MPGEGKRVLIVEDDGEAALAVEETLVRLGYSIAGVAKTGEDALDLVASGAPDVVLMDLALGGQLDGIETAARIGVPVIFLTGHSDDETLARARTVGPFGYLVKPASAATLHAAIQVAFTRLALEQRLASAARLAAVGMTTANVAHEIANPLAAMLVNIELASDIAAKLCVPAAQAEVVDDLRVVLRETKDGAERIRRVVQDVRRLVVDDEPRERESNIGALVDEAIGIAAGLGHALGRVERRYGEAPRIAVAPGEARRIFTSVALQIAEVVAEHDGPITPAVWVETGMDEHGRAVVTFGTNASARSEQDGLMVVREIVGSLRGEVVVETVKGHCVRVVLPQA